MLASARLDVTWMQTIQLVSANTRAPSSKMFMRNSEAVEPPPQAELTSPATKYAEKRNPLDELEAALGVWCGARGAEVR